MASSQKRAVQNYRTRLHERGLARFEVLGRDADRDLIRPLARRLAEGGPEASRLRAVVSRAAGPPPEKGGILAALRHHHPDERLGALAAVRAHTAGGYAALTLFADDAEVLTVEYKLNLMAPAEGDHLEAVGTVLKSGRTLTVCRLEVYGVRAEQRTMVAAGQQTLIRIAG